MSFITPERRIAFQQHLRESENLTMTGAKKNIKS